MSSRLISTALAVLLVSFGACREAPLPSSISDAARQYDVLRKAGAPLYVPESFTGYEQALSEAKRMLLEEKTRWRPFRNYEQTAAQFDVVLRLGREILKETVEERAVRIARIDTEIENALERLQGVHNLGAAINEGRLMRSRSTKARTLLAEARSFLSSGDLDRAETRLAESLSETEKALGRVPPAVQRYSDVTEIARWRGVAQSVIEESRRKRGYALVVSKAARTLALYRSGRAVETFPVGLGVNGFSDKLYEGDKATPEGRYEIVRKVASSRYGRALLLNYPNDEDRQRFREAKREGRLAPGARIGGLVEIHGGGKDFMTLGCISLDNEEMERLFQTVGNGTPVAIVGALRMDNSISTALRDVGIP